MLDHFLKIAYDKSVVQAEQDRVHVLLKQLPVDDLYKLATGDMTKEALFDCAPSGNVGHSDSWIDKFKNTPLFEQAVALEQEEIQLEMDELQKRKERTLQSQSESNVWDLRDQLRLKKRLLDLQAAQADVTGQMPPAPAEAQGAGALGSETPNPEKTVTAMVQMAETMGRSLARTDFRKEASHRVLVTAGDQAGRSLVGMQKNAFDMNSLKGIGQGAVNLLKTNRGAAIGAGIGAAGGLMHGLQKDQSGQRHLLSGLAQGAVGGAVGAAAGHAAAGIGKRVQQGQGLMQAAQGYGGEVKGMLNKGPSLGSLQQQSIAGNAAKPLENVSINMNGTGGVPSLAAPNAATPAPSRWGGMLQKAKQAITPTPKPELGGVFA